MLTLAATKSLIESAKENLTRVQGDAPDLDIRSQAGNSLLFIGYALERVSDREHDEKWDGMLKHLHD